MSDKNSSGGPTPVKPTTVTVTRRLELLNQRVEPNTRQRRQRKVKPTEGPADWSDVLGELDQIRQIARTPRTQSTGYIRHKQAGKLWVRERVELLIDPGTFREIGSAAGITTRITPSGVKNSVVEEEKQAVRDFVPSNNVQGFAKIGGRRVLLTADDFTIREGHADGALMPKALYMEKSAVHLKLPMIKLVDGASGGGSITTYRAQNGTYIPDLKLLPRFPGFRVFFANSLAGLVGESLATNCPCCLGMRPTW